MFSSSVLRLHAEVTGDDGTISVFNPFSPQYGHRMKVTTALGTRKERFSRKATYDFQLEAFVGRRRGRCLLPDDGGRRHPYDGAHRRHLHRGRPARCANPRRSPDAARRGRPSALADAALDAAAGCQAAELRVERIRSQMVRLHDAVPETTADDTDFGMGVRVVADGAVGLRRHGRRPAGRGGQPRAPGHGDGAGDEPGPGAGGSSWRPSRPTVT